METFEQNVHSLWPDFSPQLIDNRIEKPKSFLMLLIKPVRFKKNMRCTEGKYLFISTISLHPA
jgi:hypothetical protein